MFEVSNLGVITQDTSNLDNEAQQVFKDAFGSEINMDTGTPQGQLKTSLTTILNEAQAGAVKLANSFNVLTATGVELDTIGALFGYIRKENTKTIVYATLTGTANTIINSGSKVSNGSYEFELLENVIIGNEGKANAYFQCTTSGEIPCLANTLTTIIDTQTGWDAVNNESNGIVGIEKETDNIFRQRITANWLNIRAKGSIGSIIDSVAQLNNVVSVVGNENINSVFTNIDGINMKPHSIYLSVLGGSGEDIARVLANKKNLGCAVNGDTTISYYDVDFGKECYYQIYRPTAVNFKVKIFYKENRYTTQNIEETIQNIISDYTTNNPFMINQTINDGLFYNIFKDFNLADILSIKVSNDDGNSWLDYFDTSVLTYGVYQETIMEKVE